MNDKNKNNSRHRATHVSEEAIRYGTDDLTIGPDLYNIVCGATALQGGEADEDTQ